MDYIIIKLLLYIAKVVTFGPTMQTSIAYYDLQAEVKREMEKISK